MFRAQVESFRDFLVWDTCLENQISLGKFPSHISFLAPFLCPQSVGRSYFFGTQWLLYRAAGRQLYCPKKRVTRAKTREGGHKSSSGGGGSSSRASVNWLILSSIEARSQRYQKDQNELRSAKIRLFLRPEGPLLSFDLVTLGLAAPNARHGFGKPPAVERWRADASRMAH